LFVNCIKVPFASNWSPGKSKDGALAMYPPLENKPIKVKIHEI
jgi:hypothetical protein